MNISDEIKPLNWVGDSLKQLKGMPEDVREVFGFALFLAQNGEKHRFAKPLKGFSGAGVLEIVENFDGNTYRAVYTVKFVEAIYVLHVFQKKSKKDIATPKHDIKLIESRLREVQKRNNR